MLIDMDNKKQYLTVSQTARILQLSSDRVRQLDRTGVLHPDQVTALGRLYLPETVEQFRASREAASDGPVGDSDGSAT
jgi:DNA-binding transcriptional MerR regulator